MFFTGLFEVISSIARGNMILKFLFRKVHFHMAYKCVLPNRLLLFVMLKIDILYYYLCWLHK